MNTKYLAHINEWDEEETLKMHCENVARYSGEIMQKAELYYLGYLAGIIHDMGKATKKFNDYLLCAHRKEKVVKGSVNHTFAAVIYIFERYHESEIGEEVLTAELLAYAAGAHHGLFDCIKLNGESDFIRRLKKDRKEIYYDEAIKAFFQNVISEKELDILFHKAVNEVEKKEALFHKSFYRSMFTRLLVSALIDGDRRDTEEFMTRKKLEAKEETGKEFWNKNLSFCEEKINQFPKDNEIQLARSYISECCFQKAKEVPGIYTLNVVTGGGKTLAALRYSLAHAAEYKKERIIFIIPLLSILEQNSKVIQEYIQDKKTVVEHHSNVLQLQETEEELNEYEFAVNTWNAPIIISTLVQLLNILFDGKTASIRRMQALCNSVIVIDEVQSLPWKMTAMFNQAINFLCDCCKATIVLSSATQPCFDTVKPQLKLAQNAEMVFPRPDIAQVFQRTKIMDNTKPSGYTTSEIADFADGLLKELSSVLVVCNTKKTAKEIFNYARSHNYSVSYLSTSMCMAHRIKIMNQIIETLEFNQKHRQKQKILCISTQLIEAGVDVSFESVIRIIGGLDNVVQSAGRCNRSFDFGQICNVYIMNIKQENLTFLQEIRQRQIAMNKLLNSFREYPAKYDNDLSSGKSVQEYYQCLFKALGEKGTLKYIVETERGTGNLYQFLTSGIDSSDADNQILTQPFKAVGQLFQVFDTDTIDVLVPYEAKGKELIAQLAENNIKHDTEYRKKLLNSASFYSISLFQYEIDNLGKQVLLYKIEDEHFYVLKEEYYNNEMGFTGEKI